VARQARNTRAEAADAASGVAGEGVRADLWLWAARFFKTRALAKQALASGKVELAGQPCKPSRQFRVGDALTVRRGEEQFDLLIAALSEQRGPASVAQALYRETPESLARREAERERRRLERAGYQPPAGRPDKRARRLIQALGDFDAL